MGGDLFQFLQLIYAKIAVEFSLYIGKMCLFQCLVECLIFKIVILGG